MWTKEQLVGRNSHKIADKPIIKKIDTVKGDSSHNDAYKTFVVAVANACREFSFAQEQMAEECGLKTALAASIKAEQAACRVATVLHKPSRRTFDYKVAALSIVEQLNHVAGADRVPMQAGETEDFYATNVYDEMVSEAYVEQYGYLEYSYTTPIYDRCLYPYEIEDYLKEHGIRYRVSNAYDREGIETDNGQPENAPWEFVPWINLNTTWKLAAWLGY